MNEFSYQIRSLTRTDGAQYRQLRLQALTTNDSSYLSSFEAEKNRSVESFSYELQYAKSGEVFGYYGVFDEDKLIGYLQIGSTGLPKQIHMAELYNLYVDPDYRGQGVAKELFAYATSFLKEKTNVEMIFLSVREGNKPAQLLYRDLGFKTWGIKPKSVKIDSVYENEVGMVLEI